MHLKFLILIAVALLAWACPAGAHGLMPADCPPGTILQEAQNWWAPPGAVEEQSQHIHFHACIPYKQIVSGTINLTTHYEKHNSSGGFNAILRRGRDALGIFDLSSIAFTSQTCPNPGDCHWDRTVPYDTNAFRRDGWGEIVLQLRNRVDSKDQLAIMDGVVNAQNGDAEQDRPNPTPGAAGFYHYNYATVELISNNIPLGPVTAPVSFTVDFAQADCSSKTACVQNPVTSYSAHVDPAFHAGNPGTIIASGLISDPNKGNDPGERKVITFDPADFDGTGWHKLVFRARQPDPAPGLEGVNNGLYAIWINDAVA